MQCSLHSKGKIERYFGTVRSGFLAPLGQDALAGLDALNRSFHAWLEGECHNSAHRGIGGRTPLDMWAPACGGIRRPDAGVDIDDMFLFEAVRKVSRARTVSLNGRLLEVGPGLAGQRVVLRYDPSAPPERPVKVAREDGTPAGTASPLDLHANAGIGRGAEPVRFRRLEADAGIGEFRPCI